jgi:hypothetical protein
MERLVFDSTRQAEVTAGSSNDVVIGSEDRHEDGCHRGQVDQHLPLGSMQHAPRETRPAERVAMRTPVAVMICVQSDDVGHDFGNTRPEELGLRSIKGVANHNETVAMEELYGTFHLAGFQHLEPYDAIVCGEMFAQSDNVRLVAVVGTISAAHEQIVVRLL